MNQYLSDMLLSQSGRLSFEDIYMNFIMAVIVGVVIYISYKFSHSGAVYSSRFNVSLLMLTVTTAFVITVIGSNLALSLGMVGALSIVRFRTAIKDPRDTAYIFWCIAAGITCGVSEYYVASLGTGVLFVLLIIFGRIQRNDRYLLIVRGERKSEENIENVVNAYYQGKDQLKVKNTSKERVEYIYEISQKTIDASEVQSQSITDKLYEHEGVTNVNLVSQNDEINQ